MYDGEFAGKQPLRIWARRLMDGPRRADSDLGTDSQLDQRPHAWPRGFRRAAEGLESFLKRPLERKRRSQEWRFLVFVTLTIHITHVTHGSVRMMLYASV